MGGGRGKSGYQSAFKLKITIPGDVSLLGFKFEGKY